MMRQASSFPPAQFRHAHPACLLRLAAFFFALCCLCATLAPACAQAQDRLGVVLLHDKNDHPERYLSELARQLRNVGVQVVLPEMPWSRRRGFDATYQQALVEIGLAVQELRLAGCNLVALAGHGLGANAALGFAASREGLLAVVALAPSHDPEQQREVFLPDVKKARSLMLNSGGQARSLFTDFNLDKDYDLSTTAEVYLSYNDPDGAAVMPRSCAALKGPLPLLWVVGLRDPLYFLGRSYAYAKAPEHPKSRYEEVPSEHNTVPRDGARLVAKWLLGLVQPER